MSDWFFRSESCDVLTRRLERLTWVLSDGWQICSYEIWFGDRWVSPLELVSREPPVHVNCRSTVM